MKGWVCPPRRPCPHGLRPNSCSGWWSPRSGCDTCPTTPQRNPDTAAPSPGTEAAGWKRQWKIRPTSAGRQRHSEEISREPPDLELWLLLRELAELSAEAEGLQHGVLRGDGQVGPAGDAAVGVDAGQGELEQVVLPAVAALQTGAGDLVRPRDAVAFLREHGDNVVQVLLAGQGQGSNAWGELGVVNGVVEDGLREGAHVHLVALFLVQPVQQPFHHPGLVGVNGHQQSLMNLPEVKLNPLQQGVHGVLSAQADGQVESFPPLAVFGLIQLPDDAVASFQEPTQ